MYLITDRKYKKIPNRNHRAEEYNNWTEKYTRGVQQKRPDEIGERISDLEDRAAELMQTQHQEEKKIFLNLLKGPMGQHQADQHLYYGIPEEEREKGQKSYLKKYWLKTSLTWRRKQISRFKSLTEFQISWTQRDPHQDTW